MATIEKRLKELETKQASADLTGMTDEELDAHLATLQAGQPGGVGALNSLRVASHRSYV